MRIASCQARTPLLFRTLIAAGGRLIERYNFPERKKAPAVMYAALAAMYAAVEEETATIGRTNHLFGDLVKTHAKVLDGKEGKRRSCWFRPLYRLRRFCEKHAGCCFPPEKHHKSEANQWVLLAKNKQLAAPLTRVEYVKDITLPGLLIPKENAATLPKGLKLHVAQPSAKQMARAKRDRLRLVGIGFSHVVPYSIENSAAAVLLALNLRLLRDVEGPASCKAWIEIKRRWDDGDPRYDHLRLLPGDRCSPTGPPPTYSSLSEFEKWMERYPKSKRENLRKARLAVHGKSLNLHELTAIDVIMKVEKSAAMYRWPSTF